LARVSSFLLFLSSELISNPFTHDIWKLEELRPTESHKNLSSSLVGNDITDYINSKHSCQEFSLSIQIWNAKFVLGLVSLLS
jgi:hypothetical protein